MLEPTFGLKFLSQGYSITVIDPCLPAASECPQEIGLSVLESFLLRFSSVRPFVKANLILTERNIPCKIPSSGGTSRSSERGALCS